MEVIYKMDTIDNRTGSITCWFQVKVPGYEWTDIYVGITKKDGEWRCGSKEFFNLNSDQQTKALSEARSLLKKLR